MGDALNALRPQRLRTKAASSLLPHWLDGYSECNSCSSRVLASTHRISELPCRLSGTKNHHFAKLRFHDFQRQCALLGLNRSNLYYKKRENNRRAMLPHEIPGLLSP
ncbi:hypothetical protein [Bathymodiolus japonicus methanotrophic gill symbiont]|uniref:hypothetical protein n=1 Tax=Bathymodiolus japonicus methanotrophic gill symbiont TaxID=113269 RepID=UPI001C8E5463|nr:hypothetical protein [Bathymodiolus japonicus methanotrophic gill symbiont]